MQTKRTWKRVSAIMLTIAMLVGMLSMLGGLTTSAATTEAMKFKADFSELSAIAEEAGAYGEGTYYRPGYTTAADKAIMAWVDEKFDLWGGYGKSFVRTYLGQSASTLTHSKDTWSGETYWSLHDDGSVKLNTGNSGQMFRRIEKFVPLYNGEAAVLANFEAKVTLAVTKHCSQGHGFILAFHMAEAGKIHNAGDHTILASHGSFVALGNGRGSYTTPDGYGVAVFDQNNTLGTDGATIRAAGASVIPNTDYNNGQGTYTAGSNDELANANVDGEMLAEDNDLQLNTKYDLTVKVVGKNVTVTVAETDTGSVLYTREATLNEAGSGYMAIGASNGPDKIYNVEIQELDENGKPVDFGTKTGEDEVETFKVDFSNLPEVQWYDGAYYYNAGRDTADVNAAVDMNTDWLTKGSVSYGIDTEDTMLVDYLTSKFRFYYTQEGSNSGRYFIRENVNDFYKDANGNDIVDSIIAGAVTDEEAGTTTYTYISSGSVYTPDMGSAYSSATWVDGIGNSAKNRGVATWTLYGNEWLTVYNNKIAGGVATGADSEIYRRYNQMTVLGEDGKPASLKNFKLTMGFELKSATNANLAIAFRANTEAASRNFNDRALFAINKNGAYILAGPNDTITKDDETTMVLTDHTAGGSSVVYPHTTSTAPGTSPHTLELTVIGNQMTAVVKNASGTEILNKTVTTAWLHEGFLTIGGSNDGAYYKDIEITRLDDQGNPVDFNDEGAGYEFGADFNNLVYLKTPSTTYIGEATAADAKYTYNASDTGDPWYMSDKTASTVTNAKVLEYLDGKFDFYGSFESTFCDDIGAAGVTTAGTYTNKWGINYYAGYGSYLCATCSKDSGEMMRDNATLVPKDENGDPYYAENVETTFDAFLPDDTMSSVQFSFRSDAVGRVIEGYNKNDAQKVSVVINHRGVLFVDGAATTVSAGSDNTQPYRAPFANDNYDAFTLADGTANDATIYVRVHIKALGDQVAVTVTSLEDGTVLLDKTYTTTWLQSGYVGYTVFHNNSASFANINLRALAGNGNVIPFAEVSTTNTLYSDAFSAKYNGFFLYDTEASEDPRLPAVLRTAKNMQGKDFFGTWENGYSHNKILNDRAATYALPEFLVSAGYTLTEGVLADADGNFVASTAEPGIASIDLVENAEDATLNAYVITFDTDYLDQLVKDLSNELYDYLDSKFEWYYTDVDTYKGTARNNHWGYEPGAIYQNAYLQWRNSTASFTKTDEPVDKNISVLVPKDTDGAALYGANFSASVVARLNDAGTYGTAYFAFNMPTAGKMGGAEVSNQAITFDSDVNVIRVNKGSCQLWNGSEWIDIAEGYVGANNITTLTVNVTDGVLTGSVKVGSTTYAFTETELVNKNAGYIAYGFNSGGVNMGSMSLTVKDERKIATVKETEGGNITVQRVTSDVAGMYKYIVTATADEGSELKANTLLGTDANGNKVYPAGRVGFQSDVEGGDSFYFYSADNVTFDAEFYTAHTVADANMGNLGTSYHETSYGLRFISRIYASTDENGVRYVEIDGVKYELADYGMILAAQGGIDWGAANDKGTELEYKSNNPYIRTMSVMKANKHFDVSANYIDVSTRVVGLEAQQDMRVYSRAYIVVKLPDGTTETVYTKTFNSTFLETSGLQMTTYLDPTNGNDANAGTEDAPVATLDAAMAKTARNGTVVNQGTVTLPATFGSGDADKALTFSGGTYQLGARHSTMNSPLTFENTTLVNNTEANNCLFANGHALTIKDTVTMEGTLTTLCGGGYQVNVDSTELNIFAGNYYNIIGGSNNAYAGVTNVTVGGNVNAVLREEAEGGSHNVRIFGGGMESGSVTTETNVTFGGSAYAYMIYGGGYKGATVGTEETPGVTNVTVTGGEVAQVFGGNESCSMTGNTNVNILGGTISRRIYGGCYNEVSLEYDSLTGLIPVGSVWAETAYHVTGNTTVTLSSNADVTCTGDAECGIFAISRYNTAFEDEVATLQYENTAAQSEFSGIVGPQGTGVSLLDIATAYDSTVVLG